MRDVRIVGISGELFVVQGGSLIKPGSKTQIHRLPRRLKFR